MKVALVTGGSRGLGRALAEKLSDEGWRVVVTARDGDVLTERAAGIANAVAVPGDVADSAHRSQLSLAVGELGRLDLLVNNASDLGPTPLPQLEGLHLDAFKELLDVNVVAPAALIQSFLPALRQTAGAIVNISSDAAVEAYEGWGAYGSSKAALDQLTAVVGVENPEISVYSVDPGDMRTDMHQAAFPGEDISDRPEPETVAPAILELLSRRPPSGRFRAAEFQKVKS